jgi:Zn-dependent M28 family amino/carboxypeptidase
MERRGWIVASLLAACSTDLPAPPAFDGLGGGEGSAGTVPCDASPEELERCVEQARWEQDLAAFAGPRSPGDDQWQAVQDACFDRLVELGFETQRQSYETGVNVVGRKLGLALPDETVVVAAHYDGVANCTGADDNASGVAGALEVARVLAMGEFDRTLVVACWDQEEVGLIGSRHFVTDAIEKPGRIVVYFNFEMIGYASHEPRTQRVPAGFEVLFADAYARVEANAFRGDFLAVITDDLAIAHADAIGRHAERIGLPAVVLPVPPELKTSPLAADLQRSDHAPFWVADVPAMMITDTANFRNSAYHCDDGEDSVERLDPTFATLVVRATTAAAAEALGLR